LMFCLDRIPAIVAAKPELKNVEPFKTVLSGGGQDFVRVYAEQTYGMPPEQVVGTAGGTKFGYDKDGKPRPSHFQSRLRTTSSFGII